MYDLQTFLGRYKIGQFIYEEVLSRNCFLSRKKALELLTELEEKDFLTCVYKLYCTKCNTSQYEIFSNLDDIEEDYCEDCDELIPKNNIMKYYKVVKLIKQ